MEDPLTMSVNDAFNILDPDMPSYSYPDAYVDYQVPDFFNTSFLSGAQFNYPTEQSSSQLDNFNNLSQSNNNNNNSANSSSIGNNMLEFSKPNEDLSHFFCDSPFNSPTP